MPELPFCKPGFYLWGGVELPLEFALRPFSIIGEQGSGKSSYIKLLLLSAMQAVANGYSERLFVTDFNGDEYKALFDLYLGRSSYKYIEPFDTKRGAEWRMFASFRTAAEAEEFGRLISPCLPNVTQPFFDEATSNIMGGLSASVWLARGARGDLSSDEGGVCHYCSHPLKILEGLNLAPEYNRERIGLWFGAKANPNKDVLMTLSNRVEAVRAAADSWKKSSDRFTTDDFRDGRYALILGRSHNFPEATKALTRAFFGIINRTVLSDRSSTLPRTWMFLDELPQFAGRLESLPQSLALGRTRGLASVISYQDRGLMLETYGPHLTQAISALTPQKGFCRNSDPDTAEWISRHFGETQRSYHTQSVSYPPGQAPSYSVAQHIDRVRVVRPEDIMRLPIPTPLGGSIWAYFISPVLQMNYLCPLSTEMLHRVLPSLGEGEREEEPSLAPQLRDTSAAPDTLPPPAASEPTPEPSTDPDDDLPYLTREDPWSA
jgi:hypothetical protein